MGERPYEGSCVCTHLHAWMRGCSRLQRQGNQNKRGGHFKIKRAKISGKTLVQVTLTEAEIYGLLWHFLDVLPWSCLSIFHPWMPRELKKNPSLTADSRKELLSQHFSSLPQTEACQPEHRLFHVSLKPHAQVLGSNRPIIQLHRAAKAPQQEMFIWLCCRNTQPSSVSKQRWKGDNNFNKSHLMRWFLNLTGAFAGTAVHM